MDRDQREVLHCLAYFYLIAGRERRALALLQLVERAAPDDPGVLRTLAHALTETGQPERALEVLDRLAAAEGLAAEGMTPGALLLRSRALHRLGHRDEARRCFGAFVQTRAGHATEAVAPEVASQPAGGPA